MLPNADAIRQCTSVLKERSTAKIVAVNDNVVAKFGIGVRAWEGQALIYLEREVPSVPAPRLYAMYKDSNELFLLMQRAPGASLDSVWDSLKGSEKDSIFATLESVFQALRAAECPWPNFIGSLDGGGVHHYLFYHPKGGGKNLGPFSSEAAFLKGMVGCFRALAERNGRTDYRIDFYEKHLPGALQTGRRPVLTHGDVQRHNIMVAERPNGNSERSFDIMLVDWELSGWLPDFWETFSTMSLFDLYAWEDDWRCRVEQFLPVSAPELALMIMYDKDMR